MTVIPFYAARHPEMFAIELAAVDRPGHVVTELDRLLPASGRVLDIGAGDGSVSERLATSSRRIVALDPEVRTMRRDRPLHWVAGEAERLPFADATFAAAYATWAYFFTDAGLDPSVGLAEVERVVSPGGTIAIVDSIGGDEFTALAGASISALPRWWAARGYRMRTVETEVAFDTLQDAQRLLGFFFGPRAREQARLRLSYRVGIFVRTR